MKNFGVEISRKTVCSVASRCVSCRLCVGKRHLEDGEDRSTRSCEDGGGLNCLRIIALILAVLHIPVLLRQC
jgi:hypothetical protein